MSINKDITVSSVKMSDSSKSKEYWDKYYEASIGIGGHTDEAVFESLVKGRALEVGCGRGGRIGRIKKADTKIGIDPSVKAIEHAIKSYSDTKFIVGDACLLPFDDNEFDFVYSIEVIEHVKDYEKMIREMLRVCKNGEKCFIQTPNYPIKRVYDILYWILGRKKTPKDDYTHVSKFGFKELNRAVKECGGEIEMLRSRNILLDQKISMLNTFRKKAGFLSLLCGQKTIVIFRKE